MGETIPFPATESAEAGDDDGGEADGLSWADELFREAPLPGATPPDDIFDDPEEGEPEANEGEEDPDGIESSEEDSAALQSEESGWFAEGQGRVVPAEVATEEPPRASAAPWVLLTVVVVALLGLVWLSQQGQFGIGEGSGSGAPGGEPTDTEPVPGAEPPADAGKASPEPPPPSTEEPAKPEAPPKPTAEVPPPTPPAPPQPEPSKPPPPPAAAKKEGTPPSESPLPRQRTAASVADRGWRALDRNRMGEAEKHFQDAIEIDPNHGVAIYGLAYIAQERKDTPRAVQLYCRARKLAGGNMELKREVDAGLNKLGASCP